MKFSITRKLDVPLRTWSNPAAEERAYAHCEIPAGRVSLIRSPSSNRHPEALAGKWEDWKILINGETVVKVFDLAAPGYPLIWRMREGVHAEISGHPCEISVLGSFMAARRSVVLHFPGRATLRFRRRSFRVWLEDENAIVLARRSRGQWETEEDGLKSMPAILFFEMADIGILLLNPLLRQL